MIITVATLLPWRLVLLNRMSSHRSFFYTTEGYSNGKKKKDEREERKRRSKEIRDTAKTSMMR